MAINVILAFMIIVSFLLAVSIHEYAHALTASLLGDTTPRAQGRQSLSLRAHLDPLGTLLCVILAFQAVAIGPIGLGWGKPVKTDPWKLRGGPNGGTLLVSLAGIVTSLVLGLVVALLIRFLPTTLLTNAFSIRVVQFVTVFAAANITLGLFNILPLYPLDGYQILYTLLPSRQALKFAKSAQFGPLIIIVLIFVLPFLGQLSNTSGFFLFHLPLFLLEGVLNLMSLLSGNPVFDPYSLYFLR
ncbi:MAG TPA: site-2 protease family protein [Ktedonobacteraceae bacterium]|nr:site-2 protease family protein [Ktedonobacteraceae bacterium]